MIETDSIRWGEQKIKGQKKTSFKLAYIAVLRFSSGPYLIFIYQSQGGAGLKNSKELIFFGVYILLYVR